MPISYRLPGQDEWQNYDPYGPSTAQAGISGSFSGVPQQPGIMSGFRPTGQGQVSIRPGISIGRGLTLGMPYGDQSDQPRYMGANTYPQSPGIGEQFEEGYNRLQGQTQALRGAMTGSRLRQQQFMQGLQGIQPRETAPLGPQPVPGYLQGRGGRGGRFNVDRTTGIISRIGEENAFRDLGLTPEQATALQRAHLPISQAGVVQGVRYGLIGQGQSPMGSQEYQQTGIARNLSDLPLTMEGFGEARRMGLMPKGMDTYRDYFRLRQQQASAPPGSLQDASRLGANAAGSMPRGPGGQVVPRAQAGSSTLAGGLAGPGGAGSMTSSTTTGPNPDLAAALRGEYDVERRRMEQQQQLAERSLREDYQRRGLTQSGLLSQGLSEQRQQFLNQRGDLEARLNAELARLAAHQSERRESRQWQLEDYNRERGDRFSDIQAAEQSALNPGGGGGGFYGGGRIRGGGGGGGFGSATDRGAMIDALRNQALAGRQQELFMGQAQPYIQGIQQEQQFQGLLEGLAPSEKEQRMAFDALKEQANIGEFEQRFGADQERADFQRQLGSSRLNLDQARFDLEQNRYTSDQRERAVRHNMELHRLFGYDIPGRNLSPTEIEDAIIKNHPTFNTWDDDVAREEYRRRLLAAPNHDEFVRQLANEAGFKLDTTRHIPGAVEREYSEDLRKEYARAAQSSLLRNLASYVSGIPENRLPEVFDEKMFGAIQKIADMEAAQLKEARTGEKESRLERNRLLSEIRSLDERLFQDDMKFRELRIDPLGDEIDRGDAPLVRDYLTVTAHRAMLLEMLGGGNVTPRGMVNRLTQMETPAAK